MHVVRQQGGAGRRAAAGEGEGVGAGGEFVRGPVPAGETRGTVDGARGVGPRFAQVNDVRTGHRRRRKGAAVERGVELGAARHQKVEHGAAVAVLDRGEHALVFILGILQLEHLGVADEQGVFGPPRLRPCAQQIILEGPGPQRRQAGVDARGIGLDQRALLRRQQGQRLAGEGAEAVHPRGAIRRHGRSAEKLGQLRRRSVAAEDPSGKSGPARAGNRGRARHPCAWRRGWSERPARRVRP